MKKTAFGVALAIAAAAQLATAGDFDGSKPLLCATNLAIECGSDYECRNAPIEVTQLPPFFRLDVKKKKVSGMRGDVEEKSQIERVERAEGQLIVQGIDHHRGWTLNVSEETGRMSGTIADGDVSFVFFGACKLF